MTDFRVLRLGPGPLGAIASIDTRQSRYAPFYRERLSRFSKLSDIIDKVQQAPNLPSSGKCHLAATPRIGRRPANDHFWEAAQPSHKRKRQTGPSASGHSSIHHRPSSAPRPCPNPTLPDPTLPALRRHPDPAARLACALKPDHRETELPEPRRVGRSGFERSPSRLSSSTQLLDQSGRVPGRGHPRVRSSGLMLCGRRRTAFGRTSGESC